jgi:aldose 1-epimerase
VFAPSGEQFELSHADQRAVVVEVGGGLRSYTLGGRDLLDGYAATEMCRSGRGQVLAPWPNRIGDGRYEFDGTSHQLALTEPENGNAIHGLVRWAPWRADPHERNKVRMEHVIHAQPGYPFSLSLALEYELGGDGLSVRTTATNVGATACPYGCGMHPYLTLGTPTIDALALRAPGSTVLRSDHRGLPTGAVPVDGTDYDFRRPRDIGATVLDNAFTDLERDDDGRARVELRSPGGDAGLTLWVDEGYGYLMLFSGDPLPDVARRSLAVEPMTCPPNAFRSGDGVIRLDPGRSFTCAWGLRPRSPSL